MAKSIVALLIALLVVGAPAFCQEHQHPKIHTVDGATNPELIPDLVAFRTWLLLKSAHPERLADLGLTQSDSVQLESLAKNFRLQYDNLVQRHNDAANAGKSPSLTLLRQQIDDLVDSTRRDIKKTLSTDGVAFVEVQVQNHKRNVRIHTPAQ